MNVWEGISMSTILEIGLLRAIQYLMVISIAVVVSVGWRWELYPFLAFAGLTVPYAVWREIRNLDNKSH